jgi:4-hydroxy-tetrahydrodipicolinate synthase
MSLGGSGVVSVVGNIVPKDVKAMITAWNKGDIKTAQQIHHKLFPLCRDLLGLSTNPIPIKSAMTALGRSAGDVRLPLTPLTETEMQKLRKSLTNYGLL